MHIVGLNSHIFGIGLNCVIVVPQFFWYTTSWFHQKLICWVKFISCFIISSSPWMNKTTSQCIYTLQYSYLLVLPWALIGGEKGASIRRIFKKVSPRRSTQPDREGIYDARTHAATTSSYMTHFEATDYGISQALISCSIN